MAAAMASGSSSSSANAGPSDSKKLAITSQLMSGFKPAKVFTQYTTKGTSITSASFDDTGAFCVTTGQDDHIQLYDVRTGTHKSTCASFKYGAHLARFTHSAHALIYASTKENNAIRQYSFKTKAYVRYYLGHEKPVVSLQMSPQNDTFLSASVDEAVRLWDLRTPHHVGHMNVRGHPVVAYDPSGRVFAVAINERATVLLYDLRKFDQNPFEVIHLDDSAALSKVSMPPRVPVITSLTFSNDSQYLLLGTSSDVHYVVDTLPESGKRRAWWRGWWGTRDSNAPRARPWAWSPRQASAGKRCAGARTASGCSPARRMARWSFGTSTWTRRGATSSATCVRASSSPATTPPVACSPSIRDSLVSGRLHPKASL